MLLDEVMRRGPGGANNPHGANQHSKDETQPQTDEVNVDNVHVDQTSRPTGKSHRQKAETVAIHLIVRRALAC